MSDLADTLLAQARSCLVRNELMETATLARQVLGSQPEVPAALVLLGISGVLAGQAKDALPLLRLALTLRPDEPAIHHAVASAYREIGDTDQACKHAAIAVRAQPDNPKFIRAYAATQFGARNLTEAAGAYLALKATGQMELKDQRDLARVLIELDRLDEAEVAISEALAQAPDDPENIFVQAHLLVMQKKGNAAIAAYRRVIELNPQRMMAYINWAALGVTGGNPAMAARVCRAGLEAGGDTMSAMYVNYSLALAAMGKSTEAIEALEQAHKLDRHLTKVGGNLVFLKQYLDTYTPAQIYELHRDWNRNYVPRLAAAPVYPNTPDPGRRLRVGYVSPDFRGHSCAFFLWGLYHQHDRERFEVVSYNAGEQKDGFTPYYERASDVWRDIGGRSDEEVAAMVRADGIDILVDLAGHSAGHRLFMFARKPAPVQVTWLGYPTTTGLDTMDWRLTDNILTPPDTAERFSERLYRLPRISHCYTALETIIGKWDEPPPPPCETNGFITFGSFNNFAKISDQTLRLWAAALRRTPGARLRLKSRAIANNEANDHIVNRFIAAGGDVSRLDLTSGEEGTRAHLARYAEIDIALDTTPYGGMTTSCEAMLMGVPVVTLTGDRTASRYTTSLLDAIGLTELAATTADDFATIAADLAADRDRLRTLRRTLRDRMLDSPLCDEVGFTRAVEDAYRDMWSQWCQGRGSNG